MPIEPILAKKQKAPIERPKNSRFLFEALDDVYGLKLNSALKSEYLQVKLFASSRAIAIEQSTTKAIRKWIYCLRKIKSRIEKYKISDIRCYFDPRIKNNNNNVNAD